MVKFCTFYCSLKNKLHLNCGLIGRSVFHLLISVGLLLTATAFRLPQNTAPDIVRKFDQSFVVESQVELYKTISQKKNTVIFLSKKDLLNKEVIDSFPQPHLSLEEIKERAAELPEKIPTITIPEEIEEELDTIIED